MIPSLQDKASDREPIVRNCQEFVTCSIQEMCVIMTSYHLEEVKRDGTCRAEEKPLSCFAETSGKMCQ